MMAADAAKKTATRTNLLSHLSTSWQNNGRHFHAHAISFIGSVISGYRQRSG